MASKFIGDIQATNHVISKGGSAGTGYGGTINSASIDFQDPNNSQNVEIAHDPFDTSLTEGGYGLRIRTSGTNTQGGFGAQLHVEGNIYAQGYNRVFHDTYHPNADKLTTARTISLSGDASGSVAFDGSANVTIPVTVANDSHVHTWATISGETANSVNAWGGLRHQTNDGYIDFGPANTTWAHIYTDRPAFYFDKPIAILGQYVWHSGNDGSGSGLDADLLDGQHASSFQAAGDYVTGPEYHNFGTIAFTASGTTAAFITELTNKGFFNQKHSVCKCTWSYAGNSDISDTGFGLFELAGSVIETFVDGTNRTVRVTRPNTGSDGPSVLVYNDQGASYSPGWREMVTSYGGNTYITGSLTASGDVTAYSDERLKSDIVTFPKALDTVKALRGTAYVKDGVASVGVIAQEVERVLPQVVHTADDEMGTKSVAYGNMVGVLIEAIKELEAKVADLENKLNGK